MIENYLTVFVFTLVFTSATGFLGFLGYKFLSPKVKNFMYQISQKKKAPTPKQRLAAISATLQKIENDEKLVNSLTRSMIYFMTENSENFNKLKNHGQRQEYVFYGACADDYDHVIVSRAYSNAFNMYVARQVKKITGKGSNPKINPARSISHALESYIAKV